MTLREVVNVDRNWQNECLGSNAGEALLRALVEIADQRSATPAQIVLAWVLHNPQVTAAVISTSAGCELSELVRAADIILSDGETRVLAKVATGPNFWAELRHV